MCVAPSNALVPNRGVGELFAVKEVSLGLDLSRNKEAVDQLAKEARGWAFSHCFLGHGLPEGIPHVLWSYNSHGVCACGDYPDQLLLWQIKIRVLVCLKPLQMVC